MSDNHGKVWWNELNTRDVEGAKASLRNAKAELGKEREIANAKVEDATTTRFRRTKRLVR